MCSWSLRARLRLPFADMPEGQEVHSHDSKSGVSCSKYIKSTLECDIHHLQHLSKVRKPVRLALTEPWEQLQHDAAEVQVHQNPQLLLSDTTLVVGAV